MKKIKAKLGKVKKLKEERDKILSIGSSEFPDDVELADLQNESNNIFKEA